MVDDGLLDMIVDSASVCENDVVLEVGAGYGNLTEKLAERAKKVVAVEKDVDLFSQLQKNLEDFGNVDLVNADATKITLPSANKVVSNIPYSISRKIMLRFLKEKRDLIVVVVQREFARKILAKPGDDNYRFVSVLAQSCAKIEVLLDIPPSSFTPPPNVVSSLVRLKPAHALDAKYADFVRKLFNLKNKKLRNIVSGVPESMADSRPNTLLPDEIKSLYASLG